MIPVFPNFKNLEIGDKEEIDNTLQNFPPSSEHFFASLFCWDTQGLVQVSFLNGNLVIILNDYLSNIPFVTFIGNTRVDETVDELFAFLANRPDLPHELRLIIENCFDGTNLTEKYALTEDRNYFDYIYSLEELANLAGNGFRGKRNFVNRFKKLYKYSVSELDITDNQTWEQVRGVYRLWGSRHVTEEGDADNETIAIDRLRHIVKLSSFYNLGLYSEGKLIGYTFNELNNEEYATNHFEHGDTDFVGVFPMLRSETAKKLLEKGLKHLSHQEDLGLEKLRKSKMDWQPKTYLKKFTISPLNLPK